MNSSRRYLPNSIYAMQNGIQSVHTRRIPAWKPDLMRSNLPAPIFCAVKFDIPLPIVVNDVITRLLSLTAAE